MRLNRTLEFHAAKEVNNSRWLTDVLSWSLWLLFILFCLGLTCASGLDYADDGWFATVAKSFALGDGYATPFYNPVGSKPYLFNPATSTGPTVILPCALLIRVFGNREALPGICAVGLWALPITAFLILLRKHLGSSRFGLATVLLTFLWLWFTTPSFGLWFAFLGEAPALSLLLLVHWLASTRPVSPKDCLLMGVLAGVALLTKLIALISLSGVFVILACRMWAMRRQHHGLRLFLCACVFAAALAAPTGLFEGAKRLQLGPRGYSQLSREYRAFVKMTGSPQIPSAAVAKERWFALQDAYSLWYLSLPILFVMGIRQRRDRPQLTGATMAMAISAVAGAAYYFCAPATMPRWAFMSVELALTGLAVQMASTAWRKPWPPILIALLCLASVPRIVQIQIEHADRGLFRPSSHRIARKEILRYLLAARAREPVVLVAPWWANFVDLEYLMPKTMNFVLVNRLKKTKATKLMVVRQEYAAWSPFLKEALASSPPIVFERWTYQVYRLP